MLLFHHILKVSGSLDILASHACYNNQPSSFDPYDGNFDINFETVIHCFLVNFVTHLVT
uniref:Uncharacterized protein n=1 Tax=Arion vulgaris TaxID=1028688 RepID=A0A0B7B4Y3_9EUPU